jgi:hypothetical protein
MYIYLQEKTTLYKTKIDKFISWLDANKQLPIITNPYSNNIIACLKSVSSINNLVELIMLFPKNKVRPSPFIIYDLIYKLQKSKMNSSAYKLCQVAHRNNLHISPRLAAGWC